MAYSIQVTETKNEGLKRGYQVVVAANDITAQIEDSLREVGKNAKMAGFRPGKIPQAVLKKRYGQSVTGEVLEQVVQRTMHQALAERNLRPALSPSVSVTGYDEGKPLEYSIEMEIFPEVPVVAFDKIALERLNADVEGKELDEGLARVQRAHKRLEKVEDASYAAQKGDAVVIDFEGKLGDEVFEGGSAKGFRLELGGGQFIEGFEDQLVGSKAGESRVVKVKFPENYGKADLAGKDANFAVDVQEILQGKLPELNDEFAKEVGFEDLETVKAAVKEQIEKDYKELARSRVKKELFDVLDKDYVFPVPETMVKLEFESLWKQVEQEKKGEFKDKPEAELKEEFQKMSERRVKLGILLAETGRLNKIEVQPDELRKAIYEQARMYPGYERQVIEFYQKNQQSIEQLKGPILEEKVVDFILEKVKIEEKRVPAKELMDYFSAGGNA